MAHYQLANMAKQYTNWYNTDSKYNQYDMYDQHQPMKKMIQNNEREELMHHIQAITTEVINYNLYLDTHPDDQQAIEAFNECSNRLNAVTNEYESKYGPITLHSAYTRGVPWKWLEARWPWEKGMGV